MQTIRNRGNSRGEEGRKTQPGHCQAPARHWKKLLVAALAILLAAACTKDDREPLFNMFYPNQQFTLEAGWSPVFARLTSKVIDSNIDQYLQENNVDTSMIAAIEPISARLSSLNGFSYQALDMVSVRICPDDGQQCREADEVFYIDRLQINRPGQRIDLLPGLRNARPELLLDRFRLDILFFYAFTPSENIETRFDMTFRAVR